MIGMNRTGLRALWRSEQGTSMVELALTLPVLVFLLVGMVEVGRYAYFSILAANAARAGVQYGAQNLQTAMDTSGITSAVVADGQNLPNWTSANGVSVQQLCSVGGGTPQTCSSSGSGAPTNTIYYVSVRVTGTFNSLLNYPGLPHSLPVSGNAIMRVESQ